MSAAKPLELTPTHMFSSGKRPESVEDIEESLREMDRLYGTSFYSWIKSEANIGYLCTFKRKMFDQYADEDPAVLVRVLQFLTSGWSVASVAEIMLKLFYGYKIESRKFSRLLAAVASKWDRSRRHEVVNVLLIGETSKSTAKFIYHFTEGNGVNGELEFADELVLKPWSVDETRDLVKSVATVLRWGEVFLRDFLIEYAKLLISEPVKRMTMITAIRDRFKSQKPISLALETKALYASSSSSSSSSSPLHSSSSRRRNSGGNGGKVHSPNRSRPHSPTHSTHATTGTAKGTDGDEFNAGISPIDLEMESGVDTHTSQAIAEEMMRDMGIGFGMSTGSSSSSRSSSRSGSRSGSDNDESSNNNNHVPSSSSSTYTYRPSYLSSSSNMSSTTKKFQSFSDRLSFAMNIFESILVGAEVESANARNAAAESLEGALHGFVGGGGDGNVHVGINVDALIAAVTGEASGGGSMNRCDSKMDVDCKYS
ncbi:hypothetical protein HDU76_001250 [Blyttiomyces sp. JEL0837]|nr:hypothetical protein HDU76_001250 [Blyttiomyces sp. JEL0837]